MTLVISIADAFWAECELLTLHHCAPWELDEALVEWGYGIGPCEAQDLVGLDKVLQRRKTMKSGGDTVLSRMVAEGRLGKKTGWGFYRYPGGGGAVIDPLLEDLIREEARFASIDRSDLAPDAIAERMTRALSEIVEREIAQGHKREAVLNAAAAAVHYPADRLDLL